MIRLRFFGGWGYSKDLVNHKNFVKEACKGGVSMGQFITRLRCPIQRISGKWRRPRNELTGLALMLTHEDQA
jgi:hypothetical protein